MKLRDICQLFDIWPLCVETSFDHVCNSRGYLSFIGIVLLTINSWNNKLFFLHEFTDHLLGHCEFIIFERTMNSTVAVSAGGFIEHSTDLNTEISIFIRRIQRRLLVTIACS